MFFNVMLSANIVLSYHLLHQIRTRQQQMRWCSYIHYISLITIQNSSEQISFSWSICLSSFFSMVSIQRCACLFTLPAKSAGITFLTLFTVPVTSTLLSCDKEYGNTDMAITQIVASLTFITLSLALLCRHKMEQGVAQRDKIMFGLSSFVLVAIFYFPVLFTGMIDGGYGWVIGIILASIISFGQACKTCVVCNKMAAHQEQGINV